MLFNKCKHKDLHGRASELSNENEGAMETAQWVHKLNKQGTWDLVNALQHPQKKLAQQYAPAMPSLGNVKTGGSQEIDGQQSSQLQRDRASESKVDWQKKMPNINFWHAHLHTYAKAHASAHATAAWKGNLSSQRLGKKRKAQQLSMENRVDRSLWWCKWFVCTLTVVINMQSYRGKISLTKDTEIHKDEWIEIGLGGRSVVVSPGFDP